MPLHLLLFEIICRGWKIELADYMMRISIVGQLTLSVSLRFRFVMVVIMIYLFVLDDSRTS